MCDASFPNEDIHLFGPGADSGTFDYFTEVINGKAKQSRSDYTPSEDDNALVTGVAGDKYALGYFGFAYLEENLDKIKATEIDSGKRLYRTVEGRRSTPGPIRRWHARCSSTRRRPRSSDRSSQPSCSTTSTT